jgi:GT2 family glycosyltransferase
MNPTDDNRTSTEVICDLSLLKVITKPFPFVTHDQFIRPEYYRQLCESFPICPRNTGPTGYSLYWGDDDYQRLLEEHAAWRALFRTFHSQRFIDWAKEQFAPFWWRAGCKIDLAQARYVPYREDRIDKERATLREIEHEPHELWVRMDIYQGRVGYRLPIHLDWRRRLISMLIYLCDHTENRMEGGELLLHAAQQSLAGERPLRITPRHNRMVVFPCLSRSHHSVSEITSLAAPRNYIQVQISSSVDIWGPELEAEGEAKELAEDRPSPIWSLGLLAGSSADELREQLGAKTAGQPVTPEPTNSPGLSPTPRLDLETSRAKLLGALAGATDITLIRNYGHLGDDLIHAGMRRLLAGINYREVSLLQLDGVRGQLALITGGGAWCAAHQHLPRYLPRIEEQFEQVVIFPSSFDVSVESVRQALKETRALVFAREFVSYEQIRHLCHAEIAHDTAFFFDFSPYRRTGQGTLLTFRTDKESATGHVPKSNNDISSTCESLDEFLWTIAQYELVKTDRAHVMIAAALLGKQVHYAASNYHKLPAIAACALQDYPVFPLAEVRAQSVREQLFEQARACERRLPADFVASHRECEVTIVMLSQEHLEHTRHAIRALQEHVRIPFKLLLLDNGSSTETQRALQEISAADARIELILSPENLGCAGGRAAAFERVQTEYVLLIDNDVEVLPGAVEHLLYQLEQHPRAVAATGKVVFPDGSLHLCGAEYRVENGVLRFELLGLGQNFDAPIGQYKRCRWVPGCLSLFRTANFRRHPYDLGLLFYYDDLEWCYRLNQAGEGEFYRSTEALAIHYHESKLPGAKLPAEQRQRVAIGYLKTIAFIYQRHGLIIQTLSDFVPELGALVDEQRILAGQLLLELINTRGGDWVLEQWNRGTLAPLSLLAAQRAEVAALESQLGEQQERIKALVAHVGERQSAVEDLARQLAEQLEQKQTLVALVAERQRAVEALIAQVAEQQERLESLGTQVGEQQKARDLLLDSLSAEQEQVKLLPVEIAEQQTQLTQLSTQLVEQEAKRAQADRAAAAQLDEQQERIKALVAHVGERQSAVEDLARQLAEQLEQKQTLVAQVAERQRAVETIQQAKSFKLGNSYWRAQAAVRRALQSRYSAFRRVLQSVLPRRLRRKVVRSERLK